MFEKELDKFSALIHARENNHVMGTSPVSAEFLKLPAHLGTHEREALSYFLPLADWIRKDLKLVAPVFEKILKLKKGSIEIKKVPPFWIKIEQESIDDWRVDLNMVVGGREHIDKNCYKITIFLDDSDKIESFLNGGVKKELIYSFLSINFLPPNSKFKIDLEVNEQRFIIGDKINFGAVGMATLI